MTGRGCDARIEHRVRFSARAVHTAALDVIAARRPTPAGTRTRRLDLGGFPVELVCADGVEEQDSVVLYFHGGGFVIGGLGTHRRCVSALSRTAQRPVLSVAYHQYPGTDLDGSVRDGVSAYRWLLTHGFSPGKIVLAGDSAGGYLAFTVAIHARAAALPARPASSPSRRCWKF